MVAVSEENQYSVKPLALMSTLTPPIVAVFSPPLADADPGPAARAITKPNAVRAMTQMQATAGPAPGIPADAMACNRASAGLPAAVGRAGCLGMAGKTASVASAANAATSISPAAIPAVVRISVKPNRPFQTATRYAQRVARASPAPTAARSRLAETSASAATVNTALTCSRKRRLIVAIDR